MQLNELLRSMARRWYLVLALLLLTLAAGIGVSRAVPVSYSMTAGVVLIPPKSTEDPSANRYLILGGLEQAVDVLVRSVNSPPTKSAVDRIAPDAEYEVVGDASTSAPVLILTGQSGSAATSERVLATLLRIVPRNLDALQDELDIRKTYRITSLELARDAEPVTSQKARLRAVAAVVVLSLGLGIVLIGLTDSLLMRRRIARAEFEPGRPSRAINLAARTGTRPTRKRTPPTTPPPPVKGGADEREGSRARGSV